MKEVLITFETAKLAKKKGFEDIVFYSNGQGVLTGKVASAPNQALGGMPLEFKTLKTKIYE